MVDTLTVEKGFEWGKDHLPPVCVIFITIIEGCLTNGGIRCYNDSRRGEVSERFKEPVLKTGDAAMHRGFESHPLRQL